MDRLLVDRRILKVCSSLIVCRDGDATCDQRETDAESPQILHEEPESVPLRALPEIRLVPRKVRQEVPIVAGDAGALHGAALGPNPLDLRRPLALDVIFTILLVLGRGGGGASPVPTVEFAGPRGELLGRGYVEGSSGRDGEEEAANWDGGGRGSGSGGGDGEDPATTSATAVDCG